jgi:hypothetical protein
MIMILSYVASAVGRAFDTDALAAAKKTKLVLLEFVWK